MVDISSEFSDEMRWYVLKVQTNRERTIRDALQKKIRLEGLEEHFGEIVIPSEKVVDTRSGKARESERKLFPGYRGCTCRGIHRLEQQR